MLTRIRKRDGREVDFDSGKITEAIYKARCAMGRKEREPAAELSEKVVALLDRTYSDSVPSVEDIQDAVETVLMENGHAMTAKEYILYRAERTRIREMNTRLMKVYEDITFKSALDSDIKRENANIDGNTAMGSMLKYGCEGAKTFYSMFVLKPEHAKAHADGDIHIHDLDFYTLTTTCCQIDIKKLFVGGFSTGHGHLREPNDIQSYAALACIAIQSNQNDQHGGQSIVNFDYGMSEGVKKTYIRLYLANLQKSYELLSGGEVGMETLKAARERVEAETGECPRLAGCEAYCEAEGRLLAEAGLDAEIVGRAQRYAVKKADEEIDRSTYQAMEAFIHNLNTMHSRAGAQTPFSSINYGTDTSPEGRLVIKNILLATEAGLGHGETAIFPIQIFRVKKGVNYDPGDPSYDLLKLSFRVSAKRMYPNYSFQDAPFNAQYYRPGRPETEIAYMGCRTRVISNRHDRSSEISNGRGNLSFTTINLPRIAIKSNRSIDAFFEELERKLNLVTDQLLERFEIQARKNVANFPFLMGQGVWLGSEALRPGQELREVLKHGTLSIGFIGLAECLKALTGRHHAENAESANLGLEIVGFMRQYADRIGERTNLNFTLLATPAEGLSGRFVKLDRKKYGSIEGVTDREYYTNSFHVPVYHAISAYEKIRVEAPYHELTNAGHITYVELDGNVSHNLEAFEKVIRAMSDAGVGYGSVNHPIDRDPVCGYTGVIGDACPRCGRREDEPLAGTSADADAGAGAAAVVAAVGGAGADARAGAAAVVAPGAGAEATAAGGAVADAEAAAGAGAEAVYGGSAEGTSSAEGAGGRDGAAGRAGAEAGGDGDGAVAGAGDGAGSGTGAKSERGGHDCGDAGCGNGAGAEAGGACDCEAVYIGFERIRRITGYLVGTLDRFNNAKRAEEHDRVKHGLRT
jgi:ribonucleoside-triphosphate reductase